jgi:hypothetical protein
MKTRVVVLGGGARATTMMDGGHDGAKAGEVEDEIAEGDKVEFDLKEGKKGMNAVNVKKIN